MDPTLALQALIRWLHVATAIVLLGGSVFMRFVLLPAAEKLPPEAHDALRGHLMATWRFFVHIGVALLLASGFYNYLAVMLPAHRGDSLYHALMGTKILLALAVFFIAEALVGRAAVFASFRQNRRTWLAVAVLLGLVIVAISGFLKVRGVLHVTGAMLDHAPAAVTAQLQED
jgi:uncharacterized membrane protein